MQHDRQKIFSLAAIVVAAVLFGMVVAGGLDVTREVSADRPVTEAAPAMEVTPAQDFVTLAERVVPSVVSVFTSDVADPDDRRMPRDPFHFFFGPREPDEDAPPRVRVSSGSGFFISSDELLTNNHVIEDADKIEIELVDETRHEAEVIGRDPATDIALIRLKDPPSDVQPLRLGESRPVKVGEWVMAVGNPLNMDHTVTVGVVSAKGRVLGLSDSSFENFIQTDAAINFGNSGGPLVNMRGEVIGINTAINARGQNLGFAVPIDIARRILPQLRETGKVVRGYLGILVENVDRPTAEAFDLPSREGAFVQEVMEGHAADKGGVKHGDVIVAIDDEPVKTTRDLIDTVSSMPPGTEIELGLIRDGARRTLTVELEERITDEGDVAVDEGPGDDSETAERLGISVAELTSRMRQMFGVGDDLDGVLVTRVKPLSPGGEEGLMRGDVITEANGAEIRSVDDLLRQVDAVDAGGYLRLYVHRPRAERSFFAILRLGS